MLTTFESNHTEEQFEWYFGIFSKMSSVVYGWNSSLLSWTPFKTTSTHKYLLTLFHMGSGRYVNIGGWALCAHSKIKLNKPSWFATWMVNFDHKWFFLSLAVHIYQKQSLLMTIFATRGWWMNLIINRKSMAKKSKKF